MKLLLALDSSAQSEIVVSEVIGRPWPEGTEVCVLTVVDLLALFGGAIAGLLEPFSDNENKAAKSLVQSVRTRIESRGLQATTKVLEDHPGTAIVDFAGQWRADLILVGSHGHDGVTRFMPGSVARSVLQHAPVQSK
jgi:nucleotide-binding universal stress UspA family protein